MKQLMKIRKRLMSRRFRHGLLPGLPGAAWGGVALREARSGLPLESLGVLHLQIAVDLATLLKEDALGRDIPVDPGGRLNFDSFIGKDAAGHVAANHGLPGVRSAATRHVGPGGRGRFGISCVLDTARADSFKKRGRSGAKRPRQVILSRITY